MDSNIRKRKSAGSKPSFSTTESRPAPQATSMRTIVLILLPLLSVAGAFGTLVLIGANGTADVFKALAKQDNPFLPGSTDHQLRTYTGVAPIDRQLIVLVTFFSPVLDVQNGALVLFSIFGLGQFGAAWMIMMMEGLRQGNRWKIISFVGTFGFILQNITFTVTLPIWLFIHLLTSPVAKPPLGSHASSALLISTLDLKILPLTLLLGYIVPSILMALPTPSVTSPIEHQKYIALWQPFPVWCVIIQTLLKYVIGTVASGNAEKGKHQSTLGASYLNSAKGVYSFITTLCVITHLPVLLLSVLPSSVSQNSSPTLQKLAVESFSSVYLPYFPSLAHKVPSFAAGVHTFLQWDLYIGSTAMLIWGILLNRSAKEAFRGEAGWGGLVVKVVTWLLLAGPCGALAVLLWERDAIVNQKTNVGSKKL
ncbi:Citreoviridin biosynthesis D [Hyphodiscus hymeniophilus]|uniref:Citreoviridin biosynthesis D n=1 Tax=Hyphodiscus hymeniophilus TaxID=353542 RepID=A0A9P7B0S5_9HELO|nr:Citreoviridin biosynthesis D [Hyphodiscus hymeniophilus]